MRVKWNRNLDGPTTTDCLQSDESDQQQLKSEPTNKIVSTMTKTREPSMGCNLIFGPSRKSGRLSSKNKDSLSAEDRNAMAKLSNFFGIFKLAGPTNVKSSKTGQGDPPSIKVVRRADPYESEGLFRTDSRRRRRANHLLQRNSAMRRSWNQSRTGLWGTPSPLSSNYRSSGSYRSVSPSGSASSKSWRPMSNGDNNDENSPNGVPLSKASSVVDSFGNSCKVNTMPAPIVTLPECHFEGSDSEFDKDELGQQTKTSSKVTNSDEVDHVGATTSPATNGTSSPVPEFPARDSKRSPDDKTELIVRSTSPIKSAANCPASNDVFIQVQITASSTQSSDTKEPTETSIGAQVKTSTHGRPRDASPGQINGKMGKPTNVNNNSNTNGSLLSSVDFKKTFHGSSSDDDRLSPIFETFSEKITYEESFSSLGESRSDSRSSTEVSGSTGSRDVTFSDGDGSHPSETGHYDNPSTWDHSQHPQHSHHHHTSSPSSMISPQPSSINGSCDLSSSSRRSPISDRSSSPYHSHHHHSNGIPSDLYQQESYLYSEPKISEVIRVTVKKAEIPEVVTVRSEDIIDLDGDESKLNGSLTSNGLTRYSDVASSRRVPNRTGILKDSNGLYGGITPYRSSTPKKVHFAESTKVRTTTTTTTTTTAHNINNNNNHNNNVNNNRTTNGRLPDQSSSNNVQQSPISTTGDLISSTTLVSTTNELDSNAGNSINGLESGLEGLGTTITTSSTVTIKKNCPTSSNRRHQSISHQNPVVDFSNHSLEPKSDNNNDSREEGERVTSQVAISTSTDSYCSANQLGRCSSATHGLDSITNGLTGDISGKVSNKTRPSEISESTELNVLGGVTNIFVSSQTINGLGNGSGSTYLQRELAHHRKLSALHQKKLEIAREELTRSSTIIQGLGVVIRYLTEQLDAFSGPVLRDELTRLQNNFDKLDRQFKCQEEAMRALREAHNRSDEALRDEIARLNSELADEERRNEREKVDLISAFELELDAERKKFADDLAQVEEVKSHLQSLNDQLRSELRSQIATVSATRDQLDQFERAARTERDGRIRRAEERMTFMTKEIQSLKDVLEMKDKELSDLRSAIAQEEVKSRDLIRVQSLVSTLQQRLEQLEASKERQLSTINKLKVENEVMRETIERDQQEMDAMLLKREELEYNLYNKATFGPEVTIRSTNVIRQQQFDDHKQQINGNMMSNGKLTGRKRKPKEIRSTMISTSTSSSSSSPVSRSSLKIEKTLTDRYQSSVNNNENNDTTNRLTRSSEKFNPYSVDDSGFEDIQAYLANN